MHSTATVVVIATLGAASSSSSCALHCAVQLLRMKLSAIVSFTQARASSADSSAQLQAGTDSIGSSKLLILAVVIILLLSAVSVTEHQSYCYHQRPSVVELSHNRSSCCSN
jgi:hypothetical protein